MIEQYTPTTEEVRDSYRYSYQRPDICGKDFGLEFDRWLAERDAEVAALERGRAVLSAWEMVQARNREHIESGNPGMIVPIDCTGDLRAALDGAPEPEWEYGFELIEPDDRNVFEREGDFISAAFAYRAAKKRIDEEHDGNLPRLQYLIVRRRKAGPWLPVEGEKP